MKDNSVIQISGVEIAAVTQQRRGHISYGLVRNSKEVKEQVDDFLDDNLGP